MIYIIDDKDIRQKNYGWDEERFSKYENGGVKLIVTAKDLFSVNDIVLNSENIILYHTSFWNGIKDEYSDYVKEFYNSLNSTELKAKIAFFSGSNPSRWHNSNWTRCKMQPNIFYDNLEVFLNHMMDGNFNFRYLLLGEDFEIEERLRNTQAIINDDDVSVDAVTVDKDVFIAIANDNATSPFFLKDNEKDKREGWDIFKDGIVTDNNLDELVKEWFSINVYDSIYIPLCFGSVWSDFMGLRMAMHIRFTDTPNRFKPIFIYGEADYRDICANECFSILNCKGIYFTSSRRNALIDTLGTGESVTLEQFQRELNEIIHINIPSNIGIDNHSVSNKWAIYRWYKMIDWKNKTPEIPNDEFSTSLYFKYICAKYGEHQEYKKTKHKYPDKISDIEDKTIVYIDDEYSKGWYNILSTIFDNSKAKLIPYTDFQYERTELIKKIRLFVKETIKKNNPDCFIIDLRLCKEDFAEGSNLSGHEIATYIKEDPEVGNKGHQIVILSASDKIWNLKEEIFKIGAIGYALKESPIKNYSREDSKELYIEFVNSVQRAIKLSYLKGLYSTQKRLKEKNLDVDQLDSFINLLEIDKAKSDPDILKAALLTQCCFLEDYIIKNKGFEVYLLGKEPRLETHLKNDALGIDENLIGHLFIKRQEGNNKKINIIDYSYYSDFQESAPDGMGNPKKSDAIIIMGALLLYYGLVYEQVKLYVDVKYIRNTTIAHGDGQLKVREGEVPPKKVTPQLIQDFYYKVIVPVVDKG